MRELTNTDIISVLIRFLKDHEHLSQDSIAARSDVDRRTIGRWFRQNVKNVRQMNFDHFLRNFDQLIGVTSGSQKARDFWDFLKQELEYLGYDADFYSEILESEASFPEKLNRLRALSQMPSLYLQDQLTVARILERLKILLLPYQDYILISEETALQIPRADIDRPEYLLLRFSQSYRLAVIFTNTNPTQGKGLERLLAYWKPNEHPDMFLVITDLHQLSIDVQTEWMASKNLFFEAITEKSLRQVTLDGIAFGQVDQPEQEHLLKTFCYAQCVFDRIMTYLPVIRNEIIYGNWWKRESRLLNRHAENSVVEAFLTSRKRNMPNWLFDQFTSSILPNKIYAYSYLSRHTIVFERNRVKEAAEMLLRNRGLKPGEAKLSLAVEICAPNAVISADIHAYCQSLKLFTSSYTAYQVMNRLHMESQRSFLPQGVSMELSHSDPRYMAERYKEELQGKVDLLILGFGAGSHIQDLKEYIRYAYNWLREDGILFLSVHNKNSILLDKKHLGRRHFEAMPMTYSDIWEFQTNRYHALPDKLKTYSVTSLSDEYLARFAGDTRIRTTYPYLSTLTDPTGYSSPLLDEIRRVDESYAETGVRGHYIQVLACKQQAVCTQSKAPAIQDLQVYLQAMEKQGITACVLYHTIAPDSASLRKILPAGIFKVTTLLKVVLLKRRPGTGNGDEPEYRYLILPQERRAQYDPNYYMPAKEKELIRYFSGGLISPLALLPEFLQDENWKGPYELCYEEEYLPNVAFTAGDVTHSIEMGRDDFLKLMKR